MALVKALTENGWVRGVPAGAQSVSVFRGVPFAAPPVGDLRWARPVRHENWEGVLDCTGFSDIPWQRRIPEGNFLAKEFYPFEWDRNEDCLYLNVWTPAKSSDEKLPVAIWIFGGGNFQGYGHKQEFDGEAYARRGIIYVSINYRLNVFGYMAHPELTAEQGISGNYGLWDQIAAIKWVRRNIAAFGGDPDNISIFGQSAGAVDVQALTVCPLVDGDVVGSVTQSNGGIVFYGNDNVPMSEVEQIGVRFFERFGIKDLAAARKIPADELFAMHETALAESGTFGSIFRQCIDGYTIPMDPNEAIRLGRQHTRRNMLGITAEESTPELMGGGKLEDLRTRLEKQYGETAAKRILDAANVRSDDDTARFAFLSRKGGKLAGDIAYCENQAEKGWPAPYLYIFTQLPPGEPQIGVYHSCEHVYLNQTLLRNGRPYSGDDFDLSNDMNSYWCNFFRNGDPNGVRIDGTPLPEWKAYTAECRMAMNLKKDPEMFSPELSKLEKLFVEMTFDGK